MAGSVKIIRMGVLIVLVVSVLTILPAQYLAGWSRSNGESASITHASLPGYSVHAPIVIGSNANFTAANGVSSGTGTATDPYVIQGFNITVIEGRNAVHITNTTSYFTVRHVWARTFSLDTMLFDNGANGVVQDVNVSAGLGHGILVQGFSNMTIIDSHFKRLATEFPPLALFSCKHCSIGRNSFSFTYPYYDSTGIQELVVAAYSRDVMIAENLFANATNALETNMASNLTIYDNTFIQNQYGIHFLNSTSSIVYHNRFLYNTVPAISVNGTGIVWNKDYPIGGNYWSNYNGNDNCSGPEQNICNQPDGIGDTPYVFGGGVDRYPLVPASPPAPLTAQLLPYIIPVITAVAASVLTYLAMSRRKKRKQTDVNKPVS